MCAIKNRKEHRISSDNSFHVAIIAIGGYYGSGQFISFLNQLSNSHSCCTRWPRKGHLPTTAQICFCVSLFFRKSFFHSSLCKKWPVLNFCSSSLDPNTLQTSIGK